MSLAAEPLITRVAWWAAKIPDEPAYTFVDYSVDRNGVRHTLTWSAVERRARALAVRLRQVVGPGERAAILAPQGVDYIVSLLGAMYARVIAVPLFAPDRPGHAERLVSAFTNADPACVLTTSARLPAVADFLGGHALGWPREVLDVDTVDDALAAAWRAEDISGDDIAYLQYTSGSTRVPTGVVITHGNFTANVWQWWDTCNPRCSVAVLWLPLFHDMGLIFTVAVPIMGGNHAIFMDPAAFIMHPVRWLRLLSEHSDAFTAGPNFAYEYCAARVSEEDKRTLDLSGVQVCLNGAEPIRPSSIEHFTEAFHGCGLRPETHTPGYGLAEATVFVTAAAREDPPQVTAFDRDALTAGYALACLAGAPRASLLVSCGRPTGQQVLIVDPETRIPQTEGRIGEIWVHGPNVANAYWRNPKLSAEVFGATLSQRDRDMPDGPWLRTGDLGVLYDGQLYITGRIKDVIIVDGGNHYPQDIEMTAQSAHPAIRRDHLAAFSVPGDDIELLIIVAERSWRGATADPAEVSQAVRRAVTAQHALRVHDFVLVRHSAVPRTSSGKIARQACRQRYLDGKLGHRGDG
jgi:fatty acid CoA ligase FadD32